MLTSRNWERERALGSRTEGTHTWEIPERWDEPHIVTVAVGAVRERLTFWPFTYAELREDLEAVGCQDVQSTFAPQAERYMVSASGYPRT